MRTRGHEPGVQDVRGQLGPLSGPWDVSHVWGRIREVTIAPGLLLREIVVLPGGRTSVHVHAQCAEINIIVDGAITVSTGGSPDQLSSLDVRRGESVRVVPGLVHSVAFKEAGAEPHGGARFFEVVYGWVGPDDIERYEAALAAYVDSIR